MKARITLDQVNGAADELNKALRSKYALMRTLKAKMTDFIRRAIQGYKDQDIPETKGICVTPFLHSIALHHFLIFHLKREFEQ